MRNMQKAKNMKDNPLMKPRGVTYKLNLEGGAKQSINKKKKHAKTRVLG